MKILYKYMVVAALVMLTASLSVSAVIAQSASDPQFKVKIDFNRWHDVPELYADMDRLEKAFPKFLSQESIGKSHNGFDLMVMTINNPDTGPEESKPAMWIEANIHGNEIQGGEICLYTIWYLMENYGRLDRITELVDTKVFYICPTVNPDGRQYFMEGTGQGARTGHVPVDEDNDTLYDEDGPDDLNGNGVFETIRKYVPGKGDYKVSHLDDRILVPVKPGEKGDYIILGYEGIDNDGDGRVNEDWPGGYDPNRNFATGWQPNYIQRGAMDYPFQLPESNACNKFLMSHPNIAGAQSYHNTGGMILRGPGSEWLGPYPREDVEFYDILGKNGERMLPFYDYIITWVDLYTTHGGYFDWTNDGLGISTFANELWNGREQYFSSKKLKDDMNNPDSPIRPELSRYFFDDYLEFGDQFMEWESFDHPQYGDVEIGGVFRKTTRRLPPRFMNEELCHRNMAFTLYHAEELPVISVGNEKVDKIGGDVYRVLVDITNPKVVPTIMELSARHNVVRPDLITVDGAEVISASWINNRAAHEVYQRTTSLIDQHDLNRIMVRNGHPGRTTRTLQYLVKGSGSVKIQYDSVKGGKASVDVRLR